MDKEDEWSDWSETDLQKLENMTESIEKQSRTNDIASPENDASKTDRALSCQPENGTPAASTKCHESQSERIPDQVVSHNERTENIESPNVVQNMSDDSSTDETPLIKITKNKQRLKKHNALRKSPLKRLSKAKRFIKTFHDRHIKKSKKVPVPRKKHYSFRKRANDAKPLNLSFILDTSDESGDELYKPNKKDMNSSDSEMTSEEDIINDSESSASNIKLAKPKRRNRDKNWKRKGKDVKSAPRKKMRTTYADNLEKNEKQRSSVPWEIKEKEQPLESVSARMTEAIQLSHKAEMNRQIVLQYHTLRLNNLLLSNGLKRVPIEADGNCFLSAVLQNINQGGNGISVQNLRQKLVEHMSIEESHYKNFVSFDNEISAEDKDQKFARLLQDFSIDGHWNIELADFMPLAVANLYKRPIRIYSSKVSNSVYDIIPDLHIDCNLTEFIKVALTAITGQEHYDAVCHIDDVRTASLQMDQPTEEDCGVPTGNKNRTPVADKRKRNVSVTPRKRANYKSPVKKQLFRKKKQNKVIWKRNVRQFNRVHGLPYTGLTGKEQVQKEMKHQDCSKCRFKCSVKIKEEQANAIFTTYYQLGAYEKQRNFICQHVEQSKAKRCKTSRKENSNAYLFTLDGKKERVCKAFFQVTLDGKKERVCKAFFLGILDVSKKTVEYSLKKKQHGIFVGQDNRGKASSSNRTPECDRTFIRQHIESFPTVSSHYTRKDSNRQYLNTDLSVQKMHQLYEQECQKKGKKPCKINVYRNIFCEEFNLAFHKPKKDQCSLCTIYYEKKQRGETTEEEEEQFREHQLNKVTVREEKTKDKERAKTDKSFVAITFDLEAVLPTPCSMVGELFYKRCLSTYNLSFYSLGDNKGTCYLWDETNGGRGSSNIGSCILMHINSIAEKNLNVKEITYYSDTCGGQNRNQFVASAMLYALHSHNKLETINHKFFERGHSEMEADSIHSNVERAKKSTN